MARASCSLEESNSHLIQSLAVSIQRRGLTGLALFCLELFKPFSFVGSQLLFVADPLMRPFIGDRGHCYARFLEDRENIEKLLLVLETQETPPI